MFFFRATHSNPNRVSVVLVLTLASVPSTDAQSYNYNYDTDKDYKSNGEKMGAGETVLVVGGLVLLFFCLCAYQNTKQTPPDQNETAEAEAEAVEVPSVWTDAPSCDTAR